MKRLFASALAALLLAPAFSVQADAPVDAIKKRELQSSFHGCKQVLFLKGAITLIDISKDGKDDVIIDTNKISCDKQIGMECTSFGCPYRIYVQTGDGGFQYITQVRAISMEPGYLYGVRNVTFRIKGMHCRKVNASVCNIMTRVRDMELITLSTEP